MGKLCKICASYSALLEICIPQRVRLPRRACACEQPWLLAATQPAAAALVRIVTWLGKLRQAGRICRNKSRGRVEREREMYDGEEVGLSVAISHGAGRAGSRVHSSSYFIYARRLLSLLSG